MAYFTTVSTTLVRWTVTTPSPFLMLFPFKKCPPWSTPGGEGASWANPGVLVTHV